MKGDTHLSSVFDQARARGGGTLRRNPFGQHRSHLFNGTEDRREQRSDREESRKNGCEQTPDWFIG
ncbi:hypothetical protein Taro_016273 [Colocasia esculenta]|uniref:Uncharacterized protein n=1 Tax=Colocasia esculenta TaxID=4460 RepID=A0A843UVR1_COLES|nr:hypothetical protein [Colocasia esculenta]